jgi:hypothetical protein
MMMSRGGDLMELCEDAVAKHNRYCTCKNQKDASRKGPQTVDSVVFFAVQPALVVSVQHSGPEGIRQ